MVTYDKALKLAPKTVKFVIPWQFKGSRTYHFRGIVDDQVIVRRWLLSKRRWHYEAWDESNFLVWGQSIIVRKERVQSHGR